MFQESLSQVGVTAAYGAGAIKRSMYDKKVLEEQRERTKRNEESVIELRQANTALRNQQTLTEAERTRKEAARASTEEERTKKEAARAITAKHQKKTSYEKEKQAKMKTTEMANKLGGQNAK